MPICNTVTQGEDNYFNLTLINFAQQTRSSSMQYLHFILSKLFSAIGGLLECQLGRYLLKVLVGRKIDGGWEGGSG